MEQAGQIIAIGGGGFGRNPKHNKIEKYILGQTEKDKPNVVFIPTASAEDAYYIVNFYITNLNRTVMPHSIYLRHFGLNLISFS